MKYRLWNQAIAAVLGYFWTACPICGREFGGHEWKAGPKGQESSIPNGKPGGGRAICPECTAAGVGDHMWARVGRVRLDEFGDSE